MKEKNEPRINLRMPTAKAESYQPLRTIKRRHPWTTLLSMPSPALFFEPEFRRMALPVSSFSLPYWRGGGPFSGTDGIGFTFAIVAKRLHSISADGRTPLSSFPLLLL